MLNYNLLKSPSSLFPVDGSVGMSHKYPYDGIRIEIQTPRNYQNSNISCEFDYNIRLYVVVHKEMRKYFITIFTVC